MLEYGENIILVPTDDGVLGSTPGATCRNTVWLVGEPDLGSPYISGMSYAK